MSDVAIPSLSNPNVPAAASLHAKERHFSLKASGSGGHVGNASAQRHTLPEVSRSAISRLPPRSARLARFSKLKPIALVELGAVLFGQQLRPRCLPSQTVDEAAGGASPQCLPGVAHRHRPLSECHGLNPHRGGKRRTRAAEVFAQAICQWTGISMNASGSLCRSAGSDAESTMRKLAPLPGPSDRAVIVPFIASTNALLTARPSPVESCRSFP